MNSCEHPNVLFLRKCFLKDCGTIEDMFDERLINQTISEDILYKNIQVTYDEIPSIFTCTETWIKKTNLKCWFCDNSFNSIPIFIPESITTMTKDDVRKYSISTNGNFCSFNCASAHIELYFTSNKKTEKHNLLKLLYKIIHGTSIYEIAPSPPKTLMQQYGGRMTVNEYKSLILLLTENNNSFIEHNDIKTIDVLL